MHDDIHIVLDSVSDVRDTYLFDNPRIHELRLIVRHGAEEWYDGDKTLEEMFSMVDKTGELPTTSQPSIGSTMEVLRDLVQQGKKVIVINCDSILSGTYQSCCMAARDIMKEIKGSDIRVIDSKAASCAICGLAEGLLQKIEAGTTMDEAEAFVYDMVKRTKLYFTIDSLEYLAKGGRIGAVGALLGSIFGIRPIIKVQPDGNIVSVDKCRTRKKALKRLLEFAEAEGEPEEIFAPCSLAAEDARYLEDEMAKKYPGVPILSTRIGTTIAAHLGPSAVGLFVRTKA